MSKNLYGSDDSLITGGIIYDETEETTQDLINAEQKKAGVYYCICSTASTTQKKTVTISGITSLYDGLKIRVRFANEQAYNGVPTLDINSLGAWPINRDSTAMAGQYEWTGGEVLDLTYDATLQRWIIVGGERASEGHYGKTKLFTSVVSPSTNMAATPASVKQVNDKVGDGVLDSDFTATDLTEAANELKNTLNAVEINVGKIIPVITGSTNNSGYTIAVGDYFEANGKLYRNESSGAIAVGSSWTGTEQQSKTALQILNGKFVSAFLTYNSAAGYFPLGVFPAPIDNSQITLIARNVNSGAIYAVWYSSANSGFNIGKVLDGNLPGDGEGIALQYYTN